MRIASNLRWPAFAVTTACLAPCLTLRTRAQTSPAAWPTAVPDGVIGPSADPDAFAGLSLSRLGATGLIRTPTAAVTRDGDILLARVSVGLLHQSDRMSQRPTIVGALRYYLARPDLNVRLSGGSYLAHDTGFAVALLRRFGHTEICLEYRNTTRGRAAVVTISLPLGPSHLGNPPSVFRVRPPDYLDYEHRSLLAHPNLLSIAEDTGNELNAGDTAERFLLDRDRLNRAYILRSLSTLRRIAPIDAEP